MPAHPAHGVSLRRPAFRLGILLGVSASAIAVAWLLLTNRVPSLDRFAAERNLAATLALGLLMLIPVCRFLKSPMQIFLSGVTAWMILTVAYSALDASFPALGARLGAFHIFMLGAVVFGVLAALAWVVNCVFCAWQMRHHTAIGVRKQLP